MKRIVSKMSCKILMLFVAAAFAALLSPPLASATPILGPDLATFAVLGAETVTNVPTSTIVGNVGVSPGTALPGFTFTSGLATSDPQVTGGLVHSNTALAASAQFDLTTARTNLSGLGVGTILPADLVGLTIFPGVFTVPFATTNLSGAVTLDGLGDPNAFWLFQTGAFTTASASVVNVINAGTGSGVFWNDTSSVTLDTTTSFQGNILALTSIFLRTGATIGCGRALADTAEVTLDMNTIGIGCGPGSGGVAGSNGLSGSGLDFTGGSVVVTGTTTPVSVPGAFVPTAVPTAVPEPSTMLLLGAGLCGLALLRKRSRR